LIVLGIAARATIQHHRPDAVNFMITEIMRQAERQLCKNGGLMPN